MRYLAFSGSLEQGDHCCKQGPVGLCTGEGSRDQGTETLLIAAQSVQIQEFLNAISLSNGRSSGVPRQYGENSDRNGKK
jgi:hypothetical protein